MGKVSSADFMGGLRHMGMVTLEHACLIDAQTQSLQMGSWISS